MSRGSFDGGQQVGELVITGAVTVSRVGELKPLLLEAIEETSPVKLDLGQVEQIDIAGLQLFCAAHRLAGRRGKVVELKTVAGCVRQLVHQAGFAHASACWKKHDGACLWAQTAEVHDKTAG